MSSRRRLGVNPEVGRPSQFDACAFDARPSIRRVDPREGDQESPHDVQRYELTLLRGAAWRVAPSRYPRNRVADDRAKGTWRRKDGRDWRIGTAEEVRWIQETPVGQSVADAIPPVFEAYATLEQPLTGGRRTEWEAAQDNQTLYEQAWMRHETAMLDIMVQQGEPQPWWLGYLETGISDVVFPDAPRVEMYAHWPYVLVEAGPVQAAEWRERDPWGDSLPDLMFPADRSWLVTTLWDDDWTCIGGPRTLVDAVLTHPALAERTREVDPSMSMDEACPPGHEYF